MRIRMRFALVLGAVLALALPGQADAQYDHWELDLHAGIMRSDLFEFRSTEPLFGARLMRFWDNNWGFGGFADFSPFGQTVIRHSWPEMDVDVWMYGAEVDYVIPSSGPLWFFVSGAVGAATVQLDSLPDFEESRLFIDSETTTRLMFAPGLGFKVVNDRMNPRFGLRVDVQDRIIHFPKRFRAFPSQPERKFDDDRFTNNWTLTAGLAFLFGGAPTFAQPVTCPECDCPVCPAPPVVEEPERICVERLWWFETDATITVDGRRWVKFGAPQIIDPAELIEITEMDEIPVYAEVDDEWPYERLWVPVCEPEGGFQQYVPEPEVRGTTG